jgi:hypothetical protein
MMQGHALLAINPWIGVNVTFLFAGVSPISLGERRSV